MKKKKSTLRRRAVRDDAKSEKRSRLVAIAARLLSKRDYDEFSMDDVAKIAGIAKGTLYLYFKTKEELCLAVFIEDFNLWYRELTAFLSARELVRSSEFAAWYAAGLKAMPRYTRLCVSVATVFERNLSREVAIEFKRLATQRLVETAPLLCQRLGFRSDAQAIRFLIQIMGLVRGLWALGYHSPLVMDIVAEEKLVHFPADFYQLLEQTTRQLLDGSLLDLQGSGAVLTAGSDSPSSTS